MDRPVLYSLSDLPDRAHTVTIGSFDGVHLGHQHLIRTMLDRAIELSTDSVVITFDPLPAEVLRPDKAPPRLCTTEERTEMLLGLGVDRVVVLHFDHDLANQSAESFLSDVVHKAHPSAIIVGEDFAFGHKRQGTPQFLADRSTEYGYDVSVVDRVNPNDDVEWSSSFVRRALIEHGDVELVQQALGRPFRVSGNVRDGDHRGRDLGYPTANLSLLDGLVLPADGIYAAFVSVQRDDANPQHPALVYVGSRPTFGKSERNVEAFLLDFDDDLYGRDISVDFIDRIRGDQAFDSPAELVEQMKMDEAAGRRIFAALGVSAASNT